MDNSYSVMATQLDGNTVNVTYINLPDECPICHKNILPKVHKFYHHDQILQGIFQCTDSKCARVFIGVYVRDPSRNSYHQSFVYPKLYKKIEFSDEITNLSPSFVQIFNQAMAAEAATLDEITGIGLRKALEFLIKDFAMKQNPNDIKTIKETFLGNVIKSYITDSNLKVCAERVTWLGNDEAHYVKIWEDKDIDDLKRLIKLSVNWIESFLLTEKYISEMNKPWQSRHLASK